MSEARIGEVIISLRNITKIFPGVVALDDMSFDVRRGEVHGLIGENGAGKSTLIKVLTGVNQPEKGEVLIDGTKALLTNPAIAKEAGIGCVYQELNIVPELSITDNLFLGYYKKKGNGPLLDYDYMHKKASEIMKELGQDLDPRSKCGQYGMGIQQLLKLVNQYYMSQDL